MIRSYAKGFRQLENRLATSSLEPDCCAGICLFDLFLFWGAKLPAALKNYLFRPLLLVDLIGCLIAACQLIESVCKSHDCDRLTFSLVLCHGKGFLASMYGFVSSVLAFLLNLWIFFSLAFSSLGLYKLINGKDFLPEHQE